MGNLGILCDKYNVIFLHIYCYKLLKYNKEKIKKWINIWYFLEFFIDGNGYRLIDNVVNNYDCKIGLSQYYSKGPFYKNKEDSNYIWLLEYS